MHEDKPAIKWKGSKTILLQNMGTERPQQKGRMDE